MLNLKILKELHEQLPGKSNFFDKLYYRHSLDTFAFLQNHPTRNAYFVNYLFM